MSGVKMTKPSDFAQSTIHAALPSPSTPPDYPAAQSPKTPQYTPQFLTAQIAHIALFQTSSLPESSIILAFAPLTNRDKSHPAQSPATCPTAPAATPTPLHKAWNASSKTFPCGETPHKSNSAKSA